LIPEEFPPQQEKSDAVKAVLRALAASKVKQEQVAAQIANTSDDPIARLLAQALCTSNRLMAEDLIRESGFMLPQSKTTIDLLKSLLQTSKREDFPTDVVEKLLFAHDKNKNIQEETKMPDNKTHDNLMAAFAGESQANRKYTAYAKKAEAEGKINAAKLFRAASDAETLHALKEFEVAGKIASTGENLSDAIAGETHEYRSMYPGFIETAKEEGNKAASIIFTYAMKAEEVHAKLYKEALESMDATEEVFYYLCPVCGNIEKARPDKCIICGVPGDKFIKY
jgi:rubrerythrin